jgi:hypothetical protein
MTSVDGIATVLKYVITQAVETGQAKLPGLLPAQLRRAHGKQFKLLFRFTNLVACYGRRWKRRLLVRVLRKFPLHSLEYNSLMTKG